MVLHPGKYYYMTFGLNTNKNDFFFFSFFFFEDSTIAASAEEHVVLGLTINFRLTFYSNLKQLYKKVANKLSALTRIAPYLRYNQMRLNYNSFFTGQLSYCPSI